MRAAALALFLLVISGTAWGERKPGAGGAEGRAVPSGLQVLNDQLYVSRGLPSQTLDLFLPAGERPAPLVIFIHGGGWHAGSKSACPARPLVAKGFAVASLDYRLSDVAIFPAQVEDCKAAVRWLRAHAAEYKYDAAKIAVWGTSAGGHLVSFLGATGHLRDFDVGENLDQSSQVQAVVDGYGPVDFLNYGDEKAQAAQDQRGNVAKLLGGPISEKAEEARRASPITYVQKDAAPFLIFQGDADPRVPAQQSKLLQTRLEQAGVEATLNILPGAGHGGPAFTSEENLALIETFLNKHLR